MVFAADSRTTYGNGRHDDHAVKVFQLGSHSGCMIAGQVIQTPARGRLGYNLVEEIVKTAQRPGLHDNPTVFKGILEEGLSAAIRSSLLQPPKVASFDDDAEVASMLIGGYHIVVGGDTTKIPDRYLAEAEKIRYLAGTEAFLEGGGSSRAYSNAYAVRVRNYYVLGVKAPGPFAIFTNGNDMIAKAILRGNSRTSFWSALNNKVIDVDLRDSLSQPIVKKYIKLRETGDEDTMTLSDAVELADALIRESIRLAGDQLFIGGQVDIATITREEGFKWAKGHAPVEAGR